MGVFQTNNPYYLPFIGTITTIALSWEDYLKKVGVFRLNHTALSTLKPLRLQKNNELKQCSLHKIYFIWFCTIIVLKLDYLKYSSKFFLGSIS